MKIEYSYLLKFQKSMLLINLSYDLYSQALKDLSVDFSQMPVVFGECVRMSKNYIINSSGNVFPSGS